MTQIKSTDRAENKAATKPLREIQDTKKKGKTIKQNTANLPPSILSLKRFIPVDSDKRGFTGWGESANWKTLKEVLSMVSSKRVLNGRVVVGFGFVITGTDYLVIDGDHVLKDGQYANERVKAFFDSFKKLPATFAERSQSGNGLHFIYEVPSCLLSVKSLNNSICTLYLEDGHGKDSAKIELYYHTGRQFVLTGDLLPNVPKEISKANKDVIAFIESILKRAISDKQTRAAENSQQQATETAQSDFPKELALALLQFIPPDCTYDEWSNIGMALQYEGCSLDDFVAWSETGAKFKGVSDCQKHWKTFKRKDNSLTGKTIVFLAKQYHGEKPIKEFITNWYAEHNASSPDDDFKEVDETGNTNKKSKALDWPVMNYARKTPVPVADHVDNLKYLLKRLNCKVRYNKVTKELEFTGDVFKGIKSNDSCSTRILNLMLGLGLNCRESRLDRNLALIGDELAYSPVQDFLTDCYKQYKDTYSMFEDENNNPIHSLFSCFTLSTDIKQNVSLCEEFLTYWLMGCARIAFNTGRETMENTLVIEGPQGVGKTRLIKALVPVSSWVFKGMSLDPNDKDSKLTAAKYWIVELGELDSTLKREMSNLKAYLSKDTDTLRKPYGRAYEDIPRTTAFYGTINESRFLKDDTGNRRFWVISVKNIDLDRVTKIDLTELWGYVMHLLKDTDIKPYYEGEKLREVNRYISTLYMNITEEEQLLLDSLDWQADEKTWKEYTTRKISLAIGLQGGRLRVLGRVIKSMALVDERIKVLGDAHKGRRYKLPPSLLENDSMFP